MAYFLKVYEYSHVRRHAFGTRFNRITFYGEQGQREGLRGKGSCEGSPDRLTAENFTCAFCMHSVLSVLGVN